MNKVNVSYKDIIKNKEYMKAVVAATINRFGDSIDSIAFVWLVYQVTHSAGWSAIIYGVNKIPTIFLQPFAGAIIENKSKKYIMIYTDIIRGLCVGFVATAYLAGFLDKWILLACTIVISCAEAFRGPASSALIPKLLTKEHYDFGLSLNSSAGATAELIGYGAAGVIIAAFHITTAIYIDMATFFISAFIIISLRIKEGKIIIGKLHIKEYIDNLRGGFNYLKDKKSLRYFMIIAVFINGILVPLNSLQAPLVNEVLNSEELMLSVLSIAITVGMILGAAAYPYIRSKISVRAITCLGCYSFGAYYFIFVIAGRFVKSAVLMYLIISLASLAVGISVSLLNSFANVEFIKNIEENFIARVTSILGAACMASIPLISFIISTLAGLVQTAVIFMIAGIIDVLVCICLCSKKRFVDIENDNTEAVSNGKFSEDTQAY